MIGHYLLSLDIDAEDRVLTSHMEPGSYWEYGSDIRCLVGTACGASATGLPSIMVHPMFHRCIHPSGHRRRSLEEQYDYMCRRFGTERINTGIRNRILTNRLRRALSPRPAEAVLHA